MNSSDKTMSITQAAKNLGINRSTLNRFINEFSIPKTRKGRVALVEYPTVQKLVQELATQGKIKPARNTNLNKNSSKTHGEKLIDHYSKELARISEERAALQTKNKNLISEVKQLKRQNKDLKDKSDALEKEVKLIAGKVEKIKKGPISKFFHKLGV